MSYLLEEFNDLLKTKGKFTRFYEQIETKYWIGLKNNERSTIGLWIPSSREFSGDYNLLNGQIFIVKPTDKTYNLMSRISSKNGDEVQEDEGKKEEEEQKEEGEDDDASLTIHSYLLNMDYVYIQNSDIAHKVKQLFDKISTEFIDKLFQNNGIFYFFFFFWFLFLFFAW